jgi:hypothetical protein
MRGKCDDGMVTFICCFQTYHAVRDRVDNIFYFIMPGTHKKESR